MSLCSQRCAFFLWPSGLWLYTKTTFLPDYGISIFTFELIYVIIYIVFIYSFIYSVTSFPVESWASMPYEHREKPKTYILYECTQDTMCHIGRTFRPVMLSTTSLAFSCVGPVDLCWWDSFYWCDSLLFTQTVTCTTPGWRYFFFAPAVLINSNILFLQTRQQDSSRGLLLVTDHFYLWSLGLG